MTATETNDAMESHGYSANPAPAGGGAGDAERLDWMMLHVSGKELRDMGIDTFDGCTRARIDAAMGLTAKPGAEGEK